MNEEKKGYDKVKQVTKWRGREEEDVRTASAQAWMQARVLAACACNSVHWVSLCMGPYGAATFSTQTT
eukprot:1157257-Pelagomonas_calceolata.AAC.3